MVNAQHATRKFGSRLVSYGLQVDDLALSDRPAGEPTDWTNLSVRANGFCTHASFARPLEMRFAVQNNSRIEATPQARGLCPGCGAELVAKCGDIKVWHWAHTGQRHCDNWWENETAWHREWKNNFPTDWQEIPARDTTGELHIADIKTPHGLVVEFQHSHLKSEEALKRTAFHKNIIWVVDAMRRKTDANQFMRAKFEGMRHDTKDGVVDQLWLYSARLLKEWTVVGVITAFDFGGDNVWLLRRVHSDWIYGFDYPKSKLIQHIAEGNPFPDVLFGNTRR